MVPGALVGNHKSKQLLFYFRQLLLCRVALGKSFLQFNAMKMAHAPPGHHSVVGRPSVGGLSFPEYVVYRGEQVTILFLNNGHCTILINGHCRTRQKYSSATAEIASHLACR